MTTLQHPRRALKANRRKLRLHAMRVSEATDAEVRRWLEQDRKLFNLLEPTKEMNGNGKH